MRLAILLLVWSVGVAHAGVICMESQSSDTGMAWIEAFAKDKSAADPTGGTAWLCVRNDAVRERARIEKACTKILDRDGDRSDCVDIAAAAGLSHVGAHDIFAIVVARKLRPYNTQAGFDDNLMLLGATKDPRAVAVIVRVWKETLPVAEKWKRGSDYFGEWSSWRQTAAGILGDLGGADEAKFLREQAKATVDSHVREACNAAADAIDKRKP